MLSKSRIHSYVNNVLYSLYIFFQKSMGNFPLKITMKFTRYQELHYANIFGRCYFPGPCSVNWCRFYMYYYKLVFSCKKSPLNPKGFKPLVSCSLLCQLILKVGCSRKSHNKEIKYFVYDSQCGKNATHCNKQVCMYFQ